MEKKGRILTKLSMLAVAKPKGKRDVFESVEGNRSCVLVNEHGMCNETDLTSNDQ